MRLAALCVAALLCACSAGQSARSTAPTTTPAAAASQAGAPQPLAASTGCGSSPVFQGNIPRWLDDAGAHNNPLDLPYVIAHPPLAAGFLFSDPLHAGQMDNPPNKILWVVRTPRNGSPLTVDAHPLGAASPAVHQTFPDNAGPGEIYPSGVAVPSAGCWQLDLHWAGTHAQVELDYLSP